MFARIWKYFFDLHTHEYVFTFVFIRRKHLYLICWNSVTYLKKIISKHFNKILILDKKNGKFDNVVLEPIWISLSSRPSTPPLTYNQKHAVANYSGNVFMRENTWPILDKCQVMLYALFVLSREISWASRKAWQQCKICKCFVAFVKK